MNKWLKIFIILVVVGIIGVALGYKFVYNKPHKNYVKAKADFSMTTKNLFTDYQNDKLSSEQKYNGKVLEISGTLNKVDFYESMTIGVFVLDEGMFGNEGIRCTMLPDYAESMASMAGNNIVIKGYCTGYNDIDVILEKCSIVKP